jgi:protein gp37
MAKTKIDWTEEVWNPVTGCTKISLGCQNCYAEKMAKRLQAMGQKNYINGFDVAMHEDMLDKPLRMKKPKMIFVNSMSDLFHKDVPTEFIKKVFAVMKEAKQHTFQILTKRSGRLFKLSKELEWTDNIWMGVSVENSAYYWRINDLKQTGAKTKFISFEPLLENINNTDFSGIDWVIVGGESGSNARPIKKEWVENIRDACIEQEIPFFFKQWGGVNKKKTGRILDGKTWDEMPVRK